MTDEPSPVPTFPTSPPSGDEVRPDDQRITLSKPAAPSSPPTPATELPATLGRYRILARLGEGGFGVVYKGHDDNLRRTVAIKVPHRHRLTGPQAIEEFLTEARLLASLDHPHIVPVYDSDRTADGLCFVVSRFMEGGDLLGRLQRGRLSPFKAAELIAAIADALHHAHRKGLVHRDVKPANILLDPDGKPYLADFGLALREEDFGKRAGTTGTPRYMSPEQARGEAHRVDGRSDVFSLGAVFYELLTGRRAFRGETLSEVLEQVMRVDPRPPRQIDDTLPRELERICLKALAKRAAEHWTTARDMADDLRHWLAQARGAAPAVVAPSSVVVPPSPAPRPLRIVPKGLRSFDANDADFFVELLPGPRDRDGLPESLRFWKTRLEQRDADETFAVGLLYGPSGCGKSSLVKAGLLPRLARHVTAIYVEATAEDTEARLLRGLHKHCPALPANLDLVESVAELRRSRGETKVVLVLDQFEQWLHARRGEANAKLVQALRQCDGGRVQAVVFVRDDFWLAVSRFLADLEIEARQGDNVGLIDLFDGLHARKVLEQFGRAFGRLAESPAPLTAEQEAFLDQAVHGLAREGKVAPVRLALCAEMVKARPWTAATLAAVGGAEGVGVAFLEETFAGPTANPLHRRRQKEARALLRALLPEQGTDIKGNMRTEAELRQAVGGGPREFAELLRILDAELRLITPTDPEGIEDDTQARSASEGHDRQRYYQLTHDYLVPSLRTWLTRKQRETRRGRAELRLAERAALWSGKPEHRHLPAWWEWMTIRLWTRQRDWTATQHKMMQRATRYHRVRGVVLLLFLAILGGLGWMVREQVRRDNRATHVAGLVQRLLDADTAQVPAIVAELDGYRDLADPRLRQELDGAEPGSRRRLHAALGLLPVDATQADYLLGRLREATPADVLVLRDALAAHGPALRERLWSVVRQPPAKHEGQRLRAAAALAVYDPDAATWKDTAAPVVRQLVTESPVHLGAWLEAFRPVKDHLTPALAAVFRDRNPDHAAERGLATSVLVDYAPGQPELLASLAMDAEERQFAALYPKLLAVGEEASKTLLAELDRKAEVHWNDPPPAASWKTPDATLVRRIEAAGGLVAERFALCQTLPLADVAAVTEALRPCGYRPIRLRPYAAGASVCAAIVWTRDGRDGRLAHGLTPPDVRARDEQQRQKGFRPVDVAGYREGDTNRYAAVWTRRQGEEEGRLYVGVAAQLNKAAGSPLFAAKMRPLTLHVLGVPGGETRWSSAFRKPANDAYASWDAGERSFGDVITTNDKLVTDVSLRIDSGRVVGEAAAWLGAAPWVPLAWRSNQAQLGYPARRYALTRRSDATFEQTELHGLSPAAHLARCRELAAQGYRPAALSVVSLARRERPRPGDALAVSLWHRPVVREEAKDQLAKRQAGAAATLLRLGYAERVWPLLRHRPDPRVRSYLLRSVGLLGCDPQLFWKRLASEPDASARRALLLCLGEFGKEALPEVRREAWLPRLLELYRQDPDAGIHGAAAWVLRQWGRREQLKTVDAELAIRDAATARRGVLPPAGRRWYVNGQKQTLVIVPGPSTFWMGSPRLEAEREEGVEGRTEMRHFQRINRTYALAAREVTVAQFKKFREDFNYFKEYSPTAEQPVNAVGWYQAAAYCNWLSKQEGLPPEEWCYLPNKDDKFAEGMRAKANFLSLRGYRLPTEAEWEHACRAGSVTARPYGATDELLGRYAWFTKNSQDRGMLAAGSLRPNDLGLFDMLGNAYEWCHDPFEYYEAGTPDNPNEDRGDVKYISDKNSRLLHGGAFTDPARLVRSSVRGRLRPADRLINMGFRPARTFP